MIDKRTTHYKEDFEHACTELKRQDNDLRHLRKRVGAKNLEIAELKARVDGLLLEEVGAKKAFGVVADSNKDLKIRVLNQGKTIGSLMTELYKSRQPGRQVEKIEGGHNDAM